MLAKACEGGGISRAAELKQSLEGFSTCFFFKDGTLPCLRRERRDRGGNREGTTSHVDERKIEEFIQEAVESFSVAFGNWWTAESSGEH